MRVLGLIPARGGSKGVARKNARPIAGRPLLEWTAEAALGTRRLAQLVLTTDDAEIAAIGERCGLTVPFLRPAELADDGTPMIDVIMHALAWADAHSEPPDAVCLLQPTNPMRTSSDIDGAIHLFEETGADTVVSTLEVPHEHHPDWVYLQDAAGSLRSATGRREPVSRRQDLVPAVHREGSLYVARAALLRSERTLYGPDIRSYPMDPSRSVNIDTPTDWASAEAMLLGLPS